MWRLGDDEAMLEVVTSANVACGFHAGDPSTLRARVHGGGRQRRGDRGPGVVPGPPRASGGASSTSIPRDLRDAVLYQLGALDAFAQVAGAEVAYVKPHGALYHATIDGAGPGRRRRRRGRRVRPVAGRARRAGLVRCCGRPRRPGSSRSSRRSPTAPTSRDGRLVPRAEPDALVVDPAEVAARAVRLATEHEVAVRRRHRREGAVPLAVRARRHAGRRRAGPGRARRARRGRRRRAPVHGVTPRLLPYGPAGWLVELAPSRRRRATPRRSQRPATPTSPRSCRRRATVLVRLAEPAPIARRRRRGWRRVEPDADGAVAGAGEPVEIPVVYDGEDLGAVADGLRLSTSTRSSPATGADATAARSAGSRPGFAYLAGLDPALHLPRRPTPRTRVPGRRRWRSPPSTRAVYPSASPGGWHLIGTHRRRAVGPDRDRAVADRAPARPCASSPAGR